MFRIRREYQKKRRPFRIGARQLRTWGPATQGKSYLVMSTSLVSGRNSVPITRVIAAITIGYHRPW